MLSPDASDTSPPLFEPYWYGRYLLLEQVGVGGMAEVFRARSFGAQGFVKELAIKKLLSRLINDQEFVDMFIDEAKLMAALTHANVVQVFDLGMVQGHYFIAMEYVNGKDLLDLLAVSSRARKRIPAEMALHIVMEMLRGLDYTHNAVDATGEPLGIVHRDVSPSNIMLTYSGGVKVGDFGIAKSLIQSRATQAGVQKGKLGYMSPEQVTGALVDRRSDIFAAGVILYETLTMTRLFKAKNDLDVMLKIRDLRVEEEFERTRSRLDDEIREIIIKALARRPEDRYQTGEAFRDALNGYCYAKGFKPSAALLSTYLKKMFADEIKSEKQKRLRDPEIVTSMLKVHDESLPVYRYKEPSGPLHGPMNRYQISELIASRPSDELERISVEDGPWLRVDAFSELRPIPRADAPEPQRSPRAPDPREEDEPAPVEEPADGLDKPVLTDKLGRVSFARLLFRMFGARVTGRLTVRRGERWKHLFFVNGVPGIVDSNNEAELLGNFLVKEGVIDSHVLNEVLAVMKESGGRIGDVLVSKRILAPNELFLRLSDQLEAKLIDLFTWPEGVWEWFPQVRASKGMALVVDVGALIVRGTERIPREFIHGFYLQQRNRGLERLKDRPSESNVPIPSRALSAASQIHLGDTSDEVIQRLVGSGRWTELEAYRVLFVLTELEVFRFIGEKAAPFPAAEWG